MHMHGHSSIHRLGQPRQASLYETLPSIVRRGPCVSTFSCCLPLCPPWQQQPTATQPPDPLLYTPTTSPITSISAFCHIGIKHSCLGLGSRSRAAILAAASPQHQPAWHPCSSPLIHYPLPGACRHSPWLTRLPLALKGKWSDGPTNMWRHREPHASRRLAAPS